MATICFGIILETGTVLPWNQAPYGGDLAAWWRDVNGFRHSFQAYDADGRRLLGIAEAEIRRYHQEAIDWDDGHPRPIDLANFGSARLPIFVLAFPGARWTSYRGDPTEIYPDELQVPAWAANALVGFCERFGIDTGGHQPRWWLGSCWGE